MTILFQIVGLCICTIVLGQNATRTKRAGPNCAYCERVSRPHDCHEKIQCEADERCFTDKYITENGHAFYKVGCRAVSVCNAVNGRRSKPNNLKRQGNIAVHVCEECCIGEYCNTRGCNSGRPKGTECYNCDYVNDPLHCEEIKTCEINQQCYIEEVLTDSFRLKFNLGCMENIICDEIQFVQRKRQGGNAVCSRCCKDSYCNLACGSQADTTSTTITTPSTTTTIKTTSSTTTTTSLPTYSTTKERTTTTTTSTTTPKLTTTTTTSTTPSPTTTTLTTTTISTTTTPTHPITTSSTTKTTTTTPLPTTKSSTTAKPTTATKTTTLLTTTTKTTTTTTTTRAPAVCYECQFEKDMSQCKHSVQCNLHHPPSRQYTCFSGRVVDNGCFFTAACIDIESCADYKNQTRQGKFITFETVQYDDVDCCDGVNCNHRDLVIPPALQNLHHCNNTP